MAQDMNAVVTPSATSRNSELLIELSGVAKSFEQDGKITHAIGSLDLEVHRGEFVSIVGPSGCGKSTVLNLIAGLQLPSGGIVRFGGHDVTGVNTEVGYLTQSDTLLPWRTVRQNIALPLELRKVPKAQAEDLIARYTELVDLTGFEDHYPAQLSGGMRRRLMLARTLVYEPGTILMDEPFGALDAQLKLIMQEELLRIFQATQSTFVFVTHDINEAVLLSDRVVLLSAGPSSVKVDRRIDLPRPRDVTESTRLPAFSEAYDELWSLLQQDFRRGVDM